jgi:hypothetical protein
LGGCECDDFLLHSLREPAKHRCSSAQHNARVQFLPDIGQSADWAVSSARTFR